MENKVHDVGYGRARGGARAHSISSLVIGLSLFLAMFLAGCAQAPQTMQPSPLAVRVFKVRSGPIQERINYVGTIHSQTEVKVLAQAAGGIGGLPLQEGEVAEQGAALAEILSPETSARVARVGAEVQKARAERDFACGVYHSDQRLLEADAIPRRQVDASRKSCSAAQAGLEAARASLKELDSLREKTVEKAPFPGRVLQWFSEPGQNVMPGMPILLFGNEELEVRVAVSEIDIQRGIKAGTPAVIRLPGGEERRLVANEVSPLASGPGRTVEVRIFLDGLPRQSVFHGMSIDVFFIIHEKELAVAVPVRALKQTGSDHYVFLVEDGKAKKVKVEPGLKDSGWVEVSPGPPADSLAVVSALDEIKDGDDLFVVGEGVEP